MKFFVDTAEIAEIRELQDTGLLDGVTTNPSLVKKSGRDFLEVVKEIAAGSYKVDLVCGTDVVKSHYATVRAGQTYVAAIR